MICRINELFQRLNRWSPLKIKDWGKQSKNIGIRDDFGSCAMSITFSLFTRHSTGRGISSYNDIHLQQPIRSQRKVPKVLDEILLNLILSILQDPTDGSISWSDILLGIEVAVRVLLFPFGIRSPSPLLFAMAWEVASCTHMIQTHVLQARSSYFTARSPTTTSTKQCWVE